MPTTDELQRDPWLRGCAVVGVAMAGVATIVGLPWLLWLAWAYVVGLSVLDVRRRPRPTRDTGHSRPADGLWQTRPDE